MHFLYLIILSSAQIKHWATISSSRSIDSSTYANLATLNVRVLTFEDQKQHCVVHLQFGMILYVIGNPIIVRYMSSNDYTL